MNTSPDLLQAALAIATALIYVGAAARQLLTLDGRRHRASRDVILLSVMAVSCHLAAVLLDFSNGAIDLGFYRISSLIFLIMGMFMDWVGIVLLIMPVFLPIVLKLPVQEIGIFGELNPRHVAIWFGVVFCMNMQVSFLSPPFGPAAFYLKSVAPPHISLTAIFRGFLPFILLQLMALSVLLVWPNIIAIFL